jgi:hypothetical protein
MEFNQPNNNGLFWCFLVTVADELDMPVIEEEKQRKTHPLMVIIKLQSNH